MSEFFDVLETRAPEQRERELMAALPGAITRAIARAPAIAEQLRGCLLYTSPSPRDS